MHLDMMRLIVISHHGHWTFLADDCRNWSNISELCKYIHGTYVAMLSLVFLYILLLAASDMSKVTVYCCQRDCQWGKCKEHLSASILGIPNISWLIWEIPKHLHKFCKYQNIICINVGNNKSANINFDHHKAVCKLARQPSWPPFEDSFMYLALEVGLWVR